MIALLKSPAPEQIPARHRRNNQYNRYTLPVNPPPTRPSSEEQDSVPYSPITSSPPKPGSCPPHSGPLGTQPGRK
ncbi:protein of unknown function [Candidatus Methylocalor cossyra]|uniref:Uncharacterized protein n=1 Tax=Candidatus Methylocalor cossyra TaxID=3108543 RepID=A0ABM9NE22_9GAMM